VIPIVSVVGKSEAGKTTLLEKLIAELKRRGYRVAAVKHDTHGFDIDVPGKDSWRLAQAGSDSVVISSPQKVALIKGVEREMTLDEIAALLTDVDLILTEGYRRSDKPKIEVSRRALGSQLLCAEEELVAIAADQPFDSKVPRFDLDDAAGIADLLEERFLSRREGVNVTLVVDGKRVPLDKAFTRRIIERTVRGMVSALRGGEGARRIVLIIEEGSGGGSEKAR